MGRHDDNDLEKSRRSIWRVIFLWAMIALAVVMMIMVAGNMINSTRDVIDTGTGGKSSSSAEPAETVTETVTEPVEVPGPTVTSEVEVPGPRVTVTRTIRPTPSATPSPVPGPTVTKNVPVPGPTRTITRETPGPTVTKTITICYSWK